MISILRVEINPLLADQPVTAITLYLGGVEAMGGGAGPRFYGNSWYEMRHAAPVIFKTGVAARGGATSGTCSGNAASTPRLHWAAIIVFQPRPRACRRALPWRPGCRSGCTSLHHQGGTRRPRPPGHFCRRTCASAGTRHCNCNTCPRRTRYLGEWPRAPPTPRRKRGWPARSPDPAKNAAGPRAPPTPRR